MGGDSGGHGVRIRREKNNYRSRGIPCAGVIPPVVTIYRGGYVFTTPARLFIIIIIIVHRKSFIDLRVPAYIRISFALVDDKLYDCAWTRFCDVVFIAILFKSFIVL